MTTRQNWQKTFRYPADIRICRRQLRVGSQSFYAASMVLPKPVRDPASALYAFCREADDAIDDFQGEDPTPAVDALYARLKCIYAGHPQPIAADRALTEVVQRYGIPYTLPAALIEGFEWDVDERRYPNMSALYGYAARVAGTVGVMMAMLMGARAPEVLARACDLGVAMQLTNIARDVGEDARAGRIYLPLDLLSAANVDVDAFLSKPAFSPALGEVVAEVLDTADGLYQRAVAGIDQLPAGCRPGIEAARRIYSEIGTVVRANGFDSVSQRAVVLRSRKITLLAQAAASVVRRSRSDYSPPLKEVAFLVDAAAPRAR
ncbi:MAG: phytoene/squalene synthase family protein [Pseudomonadota bacterium]